MRKEEAFKKMTSPLPRVKFNSDTFHITKALVLAPHPDDELLGCGGTILYLLNQGIPVDIALLTHEQQRLKEFHHALDILSCQNRYLFQFKDGELGKEKEFLRLEKKIRGLQEKMHYNMIFVPYIFDLNQDHVAVVKALSHVLEADVSVTICMYEVWTPILYPNLYINVSDFYSQKSLAIKCYNSQLDHYNIINRDVSLHRFRGALIAKKDYEYAEAFKYFAAKEYKEVVEAILCDES